MLNPGCFYTRKEIWQVLSPGKEFPRGGNWVTGYARHGDSLYIFANIGVPGRTGHDFPNEYDSESQRVVWYGKPNAHSAQPIFRELFDGSLLPQLFVRWDSKNVYFLYLGAAAIEEFEDNIELASGVTTIRVRYKLRSPAGLESPPPDGLHLSVLEGGKLSVQVNKYERDPRLRYECISAFGAICQVCFFDFEKIYGDIGKGFCHVHHIQPLSEVEGQHLVDPLTDLIPVCPNCHAMLHAKVPAITPEDLRKILKRVRG